MNAESIVKLSLRVLAIYFIGMGLSLIPEYVAFIEGLLPGESFKADVNFYLSLVFSPFVFGALLWFAASPIARRAARGVTQDDAAISNVTTLQSLAFATLGTYFVVEYLPLVIGLLVRALSGEDTEALARGGHTFVTYNQLYIAALRVLLGAVLIVGARFFSSLLLRLREFGLSSTRPNA